MTGIASRTPQTVTPGLARSEMRRLLADQRFAKQVERDALSEMNRLDRECAELGLAAQRLRVWLAGRNPRLLSGGRT